MDLVPAQGAPAIQQTVQNATSVGALDCVLMAPDYLQDQTPNGLLSTLKRSGVRVCCFGWAPTSPHRALIENSGLDGYLEGPALGVGVQIEQLKGMLARMQELRRMWGTGFGGQTATMGASGLQVG